jgi:hypothetical protein
MTALKVVPSDAYGDASAYPQRLSPSELRYTLPSGDKIPSIALGTAGAPETISLVLFWLRSKP